MMPGMNGWELRDALHADPQLSMIPVAVMTAASNLQSVDQLARLDAAEYFTKPLELDRVVAVAARYCQ